MLKVWFLLEIIHFWQENEEANFIKSLWENPELQIKLDYKLKSENIPSSRKIIEIAVTMDHNGIIICGCGVLKSF